MQNFLMLFPSFSCSPILSQCLKSSIIGVNLFWENEVAVFSWDALPFYLALIKTLLTSQIGGLNDENLNKPFSDPVA